MNRKQRRATQKHSHGAPAASAAVGKLFAEAMRSQHLSKLDEAAKLYKRLLTLKPDYAEASNNLGIVLLAQGKRAEASARFARAALLAPEVFDQFAGFVSTLASVIPPLAEGMQRVASAWPQRLPPQDLLGPSGIAAIAGDPLLRCVLRSTTVRDVDLERLLTSLRLFILQTATDGTAREPMADDILDFCGSLASQCFINEYVFAVTPEESEQVRQLQDAVVAAAASAAPIAPLVLLALAMYVPLHRLPAARALLDKSWPPAVADVLKQQVREPLQERELRDSIPRLTEIADGVSERVRQQYEENPYPRWVYAASPRQPMKIDEHLRERFPSAAFRPLGKNSDVDILVAGCGTGRPPIEVAQTYQGARVLAVDLSLTSLCYAKLRTPPRLRDSIEYAQADILRLGSIGRTFDFVDASGVLHHLSDPIAGWRLLLSLLRPGGFMHVGLYSELARRDIVAAQAYIAERGYRPTADDIRRCREDLFNSPLRSVAKISDMFSTSECRDLLFHVQEHRFTIPNIKSFLADHALKFIGFEFDPRLLRQYRSLFAVAGWSMSDLDRWHRFETEHPDTFAGMYQFWLQKN